MSTERFYLRPFHSQPENKFSVGVDLEATSTSVVVSYSVVGPVSQIKIPSTSASPLRKDGLWEATCFEFFVAERGAKNYWEFNLSPSLDWQSYSFSGYREGRKDSENILVDIERYQSATHLEIKATIKGLEIFEKPKRLEGSMAAVFENLAGEKTFWAVEHRGQHPDFHRRDSFVALSRSLRFF